MGYHAGSIANYYLKKAISSDQEDSMTQMKVLKLVYFAHGWYAGLLDKKLINNSIEAWKYGPVVPELYKEIKHYGLRPIDEPVQRYDNDFEVWNPYDEPEEAEAIELLDEVWKVYGPLTGIQLSNYSHDSKGPWARTRNEQREKYGYVPNGVEIPYSYIREYFSELANVKK